MKLLPVAPEYQFTIPALAVAPNVTVPVPHLEAGVVPVIDGAVQPALGVHCHAVLFIVAE